ncbi:MAG: acetyl-CoA synthetase, partial [Acidobacteriaceae bacterium]|nr:acetyl-CoA synthetase [Acidobacteriaceae bacterium]
MAETPQHQHFSSILREHRVFPPPPEFAAKAHVSGMAQYEEQYRRSIEDSDAFWAEVAKELDWFTPWEKVLDWNPPHAQWFVGGKLNLCHNCVDRHALGSLAEKTAILWEGEPGETRKLTFRELHQQVQRFANV